MNRLYLSRVAVLGLTALAGAAAPARADFFRNLCHKDKCCDTQRVVLPSRSIEVVQEAPEVRVREATTRVRTRAAEVAPVVGTIYMPMSLPMVAAPATREVVTREVPVTREVVTREVPVTTREECVEQRAVNPFEAAHRAEVAIFRGEMAKAELQRTIDAQTRVLQRFAPGACDTTSAGSSIEKKLDQLSSDVQSLQKRMSDVEKLLIYHDNKLNPQPAGTMNTTPRGSESLNPPMPIVPPGSTK